MTTITLGAVEGNVEPPATLRWQHRYDDDEEWQEGSWPDNPRPGTLKIRVLQDDISVQLKGDCLRIGAISTYYGYLRLFRFADDAGLERWHWGIESYMGVEEWQPIPEYLSAALLRFHEEFPEPQDDAK